MTINIFVAVVISKSKVYIPTHAITEFGYYETIPLDIVNANEEEITLAIDKAKLRGNPQWPDADARILTKQKSVVLKSTQYKSQKDMVKQACSYSIMWTDEHIVVEMGRSNKKGAWLYQKDLQKKFPLATLTQRISATIMDDAKTQGCI